MHDIVIGRSEKDKKKYGLKGTVLLGKHYIKMGRVTSLSNKIYLDVATSHIVFICGKRGGGKCLHGDTLITLSDGSKIPIRELENDFRDVLCVNEDLRIISSKKTNFFKRIVNEILQVTFKSGKKIKLTPEHPLLTKQGWLPVYSLRVGDTIAAPRGNYYENYLDSHIPSTGQILLLHQKSDIYWDKISDIKRILGKFTVYDISVPKYHNFVANDIIVHNSYTMGGIAEGLADMPKEVGQNLSFIMLDTMGIYWSMKYPNKQDELLLAQWGLKPKGLDVKIYTPVMYYKKYKKQGIPTDFPFSIKPSELDASDWQMTFDISPNEPTGVLIERIIYQLKKKGDYSMDDIMKAIKTDERSEQNVKDAVENRFLGTEAWGVFSDKGTPLKDLAQGGQVTVLDVSCYATMPGGWKIKAMIVGLVAQKLFIERMIARKTEEYLSIKSAIHYFAEDKKKEKLDTPMVWLIIDEAHEFLPVKGKTAASGPLITILREGRQPGISMILATQQPGKIHTDVMTQSDTVLSHRITAKLDVDALGMLMQSYMREGLTVQIDNLPRVKGSAVLFDDTNERMYPMRVRPRFTWHGGSAPYAIPEEEKKL